jgi:hypothetical protein
MDQESHENPPLSVLWISDREDNTAKFEPAANGGHTLSSALGTKPRRISVLNSDRQQKHQQESQIVAQHQYRGRRNLSSGMETPQINRPRTSSNISTMRESEEPRLFDTGGKTSFDTVRLDNLTTWPHLTIYGLLLLGIVSATCHHLFYTSLNNRAVDEGVIDQTWAIRIGTGLAYVFKTALVATITIVYAQAFWFVVRGNLFEIGSIDNFFGLLTNPLLFYSKGFFGRAGLLFALAMVAWLLPISTLIAPAALTSTTTYLRPKHPPPISLYPVYPPC